MREHGLGTNRRKFLRYLAMLGVGGQTLLRSWDVRAAAAATKEAVGASLPLPSMAHRRLGRTGWEASRLVFGCGAALYSRPNGPLLDAAFEAGINVFDVGFRGYYDDAEKHLGPFARKMRDRIFLISKAYLPLEVEPDEEVTTAQARSGSSGWVEALEGSLRELGVDHVDAYYLMGSNNPSVVGSDEIQSAFQGARQAGKVRFLGLSTHQNAQRVLEAAIRSGGYDLAMIAITPAGWYDWADKSILAGSPPMQALQPLLARAREAGIGLVGMKAGRHLAGRRFLGFGNSRAFDAYYDEKLLGAKLSPYQRSYAYVLEHGLDVVNADMQSFAHLHENVVAAATSPHYFAQEPYPERHANG
jgi:aryl-alcohol dehydrogenase-like predicted oxidoreductase